MTQYKQVFYFLQSFNCPFYMVSLQVKLTVLKYFLIYYYIL